MNEHQDIADNTITFLGTAGARFMVSKQLAASGGIWLKLDGTQLLLDPGPGTIVQYNKRKLNAEKLEAIICSHRHLDHSGDVNVMVEAMTNGGFNRHGKFFAPADALNSEPVIYSYLKKSLDGIVTLKEGKSYNVGKVTFSTPIRHQHSVETYGILFKAKDYSFAYIADTLYFEGLSRHYASDLIIINTVFAKPFPPVQHLAIADAAKIITEIKPKAAILTHYGMKVWEAQPVKIAEELTQQTGIRVIAARDGMTFDAVKLEEV